MGVVCAVSVAGMLSSSQLQSNFLHSWTEAFQNAHLLVKQLLEVAFHKFPADYSLCRVLVGKGYMCACMKQLTASGKGSSWTSNRSSSRTSNRTNS